MSLTMPQVLAGLEERWSEKGHRITLAYDGLRVPDAGTAEVRCSACRWQVTVSVNELGGWRVTPTINEQILDATCGVRPTWRPK